MGRMHDGCKRTLVVVAFPVAFRMGRADKRQDTDEIPVE